MTMTDNFCNAATLAFISRHADDDVAELALKTSDRDDVDLNFALNQIKGRQTAKQKLPSWAAIDGIVYPPHINMEQCSSEAAARYKASVATRVCGEYRDSMADLTGGLGVDFSFIAPLMRRSVYVERQKNLCQLAKHNFRLLNLGEKATVICADGTAYLDEMNDTDLIFIDPSRRNRDGGRAFALSDCEPNVMPLLPELLRRGRIVMMKLSPMLDWHKTVDDLRPFVSEIHIVATGGECKELLAVLSREDVETTKLFCVDDGYNISFDEREIDEPQQIYDGDSAALTGCYLYEPDAAVMKAGCFGAVCKRFNVEALDANSHLFVSRSFVNDFPGRRFRITNVTTMNKRSLAAAFTNISKANVAVRNFPLSADALSHRLKLKSGSDNYVFGTTAHDLHIVIISAKA
jgi:hypothetical protein